MKHAEKTRTKTRHRLALPSACLAAALLLAACGGGGGAGDGSGLFTRGGNTMTDLVALIRTFVADDETSEPIPVGASYDSSETAEPAGL